MLSRVSYHYLESDFLQPDYPLFPAMVKPGIQQQQNAVAARVPASKDGLADLLQSNEYETAVERYESLQAGENDAIANDARLQILAHARQLIDEKRFSLAERLLFRFLVAAYRDVEARMLLAEACLGADDSAAAIDQYYEARAYAYRPLMLQRINNHIRSIVAEQARSLEAAGDNNALLALYQHLAQIEPDYAPWFIGLAAAQLALDDREAARGSLLLVAQDADVGAKAQAMLSELSVAIAEVDNTKKPEAVQQVVGIPLYRRGNHFTVDARQGRGHNMRLLIDTGSSMTILTPGAFEQTGLHYQDSGRSAVFNTANGPVRAPVYTLEFLAVGEWQVNQLDIGVLELSGSSNIDGLLGMNFLRHFQFFIDQNEALLRLSVN